MHSLFGPKLAYAFCKPVSLETVLSSLLVFPNMVQYLIKRVTQTLLWYQSFFPALYSE